MILNADIQKKSAAFVIPHFTEEYKQGQKAIISDTIDGLLNQTDTNWSAIIIDDCSPSIDIRNYLHNLKEKHFPRIDVIFLDKNMGPGICRNIGAFWAAKRQCPFILYNDADDISHQKRVEVVREIFNNEPHVGLIYSTFNVIDEDNNKVPLEKISAPILEILEAHKLDPLEGNNAWIRMGTDTGYTNKTSSTAVLTSIAHNCLFPSERASEDYHTWMRMSAFGAYYRYTPLIPTNYRIPSFMKYQVSRTRLGPSNFNKIKARVDSDGFSKAIEIAIAKGKIKPDIIPDLKTKFYKRLALSMQRDQELDLVKELLFKIEQYSIESHYYNNESVKNG